MKVNELNRNQLIELKQKYYSEKNENTSYEEMANIDKLVPDFEIFDEYYGVDFVEDDFFSPSNDKLFTEGEKYIGENGIEYVLLERKNNIALLKSNNEYVIANGIKINEENKIYWDMGSYYNDLSNAVIKYNSLTLSEQEQIQSLRKSFDEVRKSSNFILIASIIDYIQDDEKESVSNIDVSKLRYIYDLYVDSEDMQLLSEEITDLENLLNINTIKKSIYDYLEEQGVDTDTNILPEEKVEKMAEDVLEEAINSSTPPEDLIYDDYLKATADEILEEQDSEER